MYSRAVTLAYLKRGSKCLPPEAGAINKPVDSGYSEVTQSAQSSVAAGRGKQSDEDLMISSFVAIDSRVNGLHCGCLSDTQQISRSVPDENVRDQ